MRKNEKGTSGSSNLRPTFLLQHFIHEKNCLRKKKLWLNVIQRKAESKAMSNVRNYRKTIYLDLMII